MVPEIHQESDPQTRSSQIVMYLGFVLLAGFSQCFQLNHNRIVADKIRSVPGIQGLALVLKFQLWL